MSTLLSFLLYLYNPFSKGIICHKAAPSLPILQQAVLYIVLNQSNLQSMYPTTDLFLSFHFVVHPVSFQSISPYGINTTPYSCYFGALPFSLSYIRKVPCYLVCKGKHWFGSGLLAESLGYNRISLRIVRSEKHNAEMPPNSHTFTKKRHSHEDYTVIWYIDALVPFASLCEGYESRYFLFIGM